jgi:hypothetical protein
MSPAEVAELRDPIGIEVRIFQILAKGKPIQRLPSRVRMGAAPVQTEALASTANASGR